MVLKREELVRKYFEENHINLEEERLLGLELRSIVGCVYNYFSQINFACTPLPHAGPPNKIIFIRPHIAH